MDISERIALALSARIVASLVSRLPVFSASLCLTSCLSVDHRISDCTKPRKISRDEFPSKTPQEAWNDLKEAIADRDADDIRTAIQVYVKALPETTFVELEESFRAQNLGLYLIALQKENMSITLTNMDLQGNLDKTYTVSYRFQSNPSRPREREGWPETPEVNMERLKDAGDAVPRGLPKCTNCNELGHIRKSCPEELRESVVVRVIKCYNCEEVGHRVRDCKLVFPDRGPDPDPDPSAANCTKARTHVSTNSPARTAGKCWSPLRLHLSDLSRMLTLNPENLATVRLIVRGLVRFSPRE